MKKIVKKNIAASVLTVILCAAMLCSAAYAYFQCSVTSSGNRIEAANYGISVTDADGNPVTDSYTSVLSENDLHTFSVTATGSATTGYAVITIADAAATVAATEESAVDGENQEEAAADDNSREASVARVYYTPQLAPGSTITLHIYAAPGHSISFDGNWGKYSGEDVLTLSGDEGTGYTADIQHSATAYAEYTVAEGDTLADLATAFNISAEDIAAYNGFAVSEGVYVLPAVGTKIKLPGIKEEAVKLVLEQRRRDAVTVYAEYTIAEGDTIESIATTFGILADDIAFYNNITELPAVGENIKLPGISKEEMALKLGNSEGGNAEDNDTTGGDDDTAGEAEYEQYTVLEGDTWETIAQANEMEVAELLAYNELTEETQISAGMEIKIPKKTTQDNVSGGEATDDGTGTDSNTGDGTDADGGDTETDGDADTGADEDDAGAGDTGDGTDADSGNNETDGDADNGGDTDGGDSGTGEGDTGAGTGSDGDGSNTGDHGNTGGGSDGDADTGGENPDTGEGSTDADSQ